MLVFLISSEIRKPQHFRCSIRQNILDWNMSCKIFIIIFFAILKVLFLFVPPLSGQPKGLQVIYS